MKIKNPFKKIKLNNKPWWFWVVMAVILAYVINGIVFAVMIYKSYPSQMPCKNVKEKQVCKQYPYEKKSVLFMTKIYPFVATWANWQPIWVKNYYEQLGYVKHFTAKTEQEIPDDAIIKEQVLDQMIDTKLLELQAKKNKIKVTKEDIDKTFNDLVAENGGKEEVDKVLGELYGMTEKEFKKLINDQLLREKIQKELFVQVHAKHILIKDEGKAKEVLEKIKKGEKSFEDLAKEFSEDTGSRDSGGDLGWFGRGMMVKEFEDVAFSLETGKIKEELTKTDFGYHIIKVEEKKGTLDQSYTDWFKAIKDKAKIYKWVKTQNKETKKNENIIKPEETSTATPSETTSSAEQK